MIAGEEDLVAMMAEAVGAPGHDTARQALEITLVTLAASLDRSEAGLLADELPPRLADAVRAVERDRSPDTGDLFGELAAREGVPRGLATEYAHVACRLLAEHLGGEVLQLLERRMPSPWRELVHRRAVEPPPPPPHHAPVVGEGHTLATGRPGSRHSIADHGVVTAHAESIARADNPHGEEKLSSGAPATEPVSTSHPKKTGRSISDADG